MTFNGTGNVVDGMINNWAEDGEPRQDLPEDAVEEFRVTNSSYKAEFGLATGGVVQVVTKSGTNLFRGTLFEYFRDKSLNALGVFETEKPEYRAPSVRWQRRRPDRAEPAALLRRVRADRPGGVLHRRTLACRSSTARSRARSRVRPGATCIRCAATGRSATHRTFSRRYLGRERSRRRARAAVAPARPAVTRKSRAGRSSPATRGFAARAR